VFYYFGFGSNMDLTSLRAKGVEPRSSRRGVLPGWQLRFNVRHFFRHEGGVGNIEPTGRLDDRVEGVLHYCDDSGLAPLDAMEACGYGYDRRTVEVQTAEGDVPAYVYIGRPDFIDDDCRPSRRYLNILLQGARTAGLSPDYIDTLVRQPIHPAPNYPPFVHPGGDVPHFDDTSLKDHPQYTAVYGAVFDMSAAAPRHDYLKRLFGGRDMTLFHLKRLDTSDGAETLEDIRQQRLDAHQINYLNAYLHEYAREYRYIGRFDY